MHFEFLIEDISGKEMLDILLPKIIDSSHSFSVKSYKGLGRIPASLTAGSDPSKRILLQELPRLLAGYGKTFSSYTDFKAVLIIVCDLDDKCLKQFRSELIKILDACTMKPETRFCIAVEEGEAWLLGDLTAIYRAYPAAKKVILKKYENDSICGTWELLANAVYSGGANALKSRGYQAIGAEKSNWARNISPHLNPDANISPSFQYFKTKILQLLAGENII